MPDASSQPPPRAALADGGDAGRRLRAFDWATHPLGPPDRWPAALRMAVNLILASPESMYIVWGPELHFFSNETYAPFLGPRLDHAIGTTLPALWPDVWEAVRPAVTQAYAGVSSRFVDLPLTMARHGVEEQTWWSFSYSPLRDDAGTVVGALCITYEQTERILSQRAQRASDERNRQILDSAIDYAILSTDLYGQVTSWNAGAQRILGWTEQEMRGQTTLRIFVPADVAAGVPAREMRQALDHGRSADERWHVRRNGERFWASGEMMALRDEAGQVTGFLKILRDRTQQRLAEKQLQASQKRLDIAHETGLLSFFEWDVRSRIARGDANFGKLYGFSPEAAALGLPISAIVERADPAHREAYEASIAASAERNDDYAREVKVRHPDGSTRWLVIRASCTARGPSGPLAFTGIAVDITATKAAEDALRVANESLERRVAERTREREQAEEALRQAQKMEAIGQLTGGVAHDFNNLLTIIRSSVDLMRHPRVTDERRGRYLGAISDTVDRASRLTGQLLAFARRQALTPEVF